MLGCRQPREKRCTGVLSSPYGLKHSKFMLCVNMYALPDASLEHAFAACLVPPVQTFTVQESRRKRVRTLLTKTFEIQPVRRSIMSIIYTVLGVVVTLVYSGKKDHSKKFEFRVQCSTRKFSSPIKTRYARALGNSVPVILSRVENLEKLVNEQGQFPVQLQSLTSSQGLPDCIMQFHQQVHDESRHFPHSTRSLSA